MDYSKLITENRNTESMELDKFSTLEAAALMNRMDAEIPAAVEKTLPQIAAVIDRITEAYNAGGRLVYCGAGTSGSPGATTETAEKALEAASGFVGKAIELIRTDNNR